MEATKDKISCSSPNLNLRFDLFFDTEIKVFLSLFFNGVPYLYNHLGWFPFYKIPDAQISQVHFANSTSLIVQSGTLFRED